MRFSIESWAPEYGSALEVDERSQSESRVDVSVETPAPRWAPVPPRADTRLRTILFTDGVRRVDARVWVRSEKDGARPGICASYAAGAVRCNGQARVVATALERALFSTAAEAQAIACRHGIYSVRRPRGDSPEELALALQKRMGELELALADGEDADLVVIDGPLRGRRGDRAVGYVKTHHVSYLPGEVEGTVGRLQAGERTPVFLIVGEWSRFSWYLRLPGAGDHPWAGVVRCEASADTELRDVTDLADACAAALPRFASAAHKDPRAPQNLYPVAGLERELRRRLGDPGLLYRALRLAAARDGESDAGLTPALRGRPAAL